MSRPPALPGKFRFGPYEADARTGELRKHGLRIQLQGKCFAVLASLLEYPGELVTREELRRRLWPEGHLRRFREQPKQCGEPVARCASR